MATSLKQLLVKLKLSTADWETAVKAIRSQLEDVNRQAKAQHQEKLTRSKREIEAEKQKADAAYRAFQQLNRQISGYKGILAQQTLSNEKSIEAVNKVKTLTTEAGHYLNILKQMPAFQEADVSALQKKLKIAKEEFAITENRLKLQAVGAGAKLSPNAVSASPGRILALQTQLARAESDTEAVQIKSIMAEQAAAYKKGEIAFESYAAKQMASLKQLHALRIATINSEKASILSQIAEEERLGKVASAEAKLRADIAVASAKRRIVAEESALAAQMRSLNAMRPQHKENVIGELARSVGNLVGMGLAPQLMLGVAAGQGLINVLDKVLEKMKEVMIGSSTEQRLREQFEKLTSREGIDTVKYIEELKDATHGLVDDQELYRISNNYMQQSMRVSSDQIVEMTKYTVALARAQGRDATQAINALTRASLTGRTIQLAMITGIDRTTLAAKGMALQGLDPATRKTIEFTTMLDALKRKYQEVGEPQLTFAEQLKIMSVGMENFVEDIGITIGRSDGMKSLLTTLATYMQQFAHWSDSASTTLGNVLGPTMEVLGELFSSVVESMKLLVSTGDLVVETFNLIMSGAEQLTRLLVGLGPSTEGAYSAFQLFKDIMYGTAEILAILNTAIAATTAAIRMVGQVAKLAAQGDLAGAKQAWTDYLNETNKLADDLYVKLAKLDQKRLQAQKDTKAGPAGDKSNQPPNTQLLAKLAQEQLKLTESINKAELAAVNAHIDELKKMWGQYYEDGLVNISKYNEQRKKLADDSYEARKKEIAQDRQAKLASLSVSAEAKLATMKPSDSDMKDAGAYEQKQKLYEQAKEEVAKTGAIQRKIIEVETNAALEDARRKHVQELADIDRTYQQDVLKAKQSYESAAESLQKQSLDNQQKNLEQNFQNGVILADQYLGERKRIIEEEYKASVDGLTRKFQYEKKTEENTAQYRAALVDALIKKETDLADLQRQSAQIRIDSEERRYNSLQGLYQSAYSSSQRPGAPAGASVAALKPLQDLTSQHLKNLEDEMKRLEEQGLAYDKTTRQVSDQWINLATKIDQAKQKQFELNQELLKSRDYMAPLAELFSGLASSVGQFSRTLQTALTQSSQILSTISRYRQQAGDSKANPLVDMFRVWRSSPTATTDPMQKFNTSLSTTSQNTISFGQTMSSTSNVVNTAVSGVSAAFSNVQTVTSTFVASLQGAAQRLNEFLGGGAPGGAGNLPSAEGGIGLSTFGLPISSFPDLSGIFGESTKAIDKDVKARTESTKSTGSFTQKLGKFTDAATAGIGAVSGVVSAISGAKSGAGGAFSGGLAGLQAGAMFGPIGAVVGGAAGAIFGGIFGNKQAKLKKTIEDMNKAFDGVVQSLNTGAIKLGDAIQQLKSIEAATVADLSKTKKGRKQLPQIQAQMEQTINQLVAQQKQLLDQLHEQVKILSSPSAYQDAISNIDQIIQKYEQFAGAAAGSAAEMAAANQYLALSLQKYAQTQQQQLNQAEQDAINNAIQLNDLLEQRQDLLDSVSKQEYDILTQGVLVRQRTAAQTKAQQLADLKEQTDKQLDSISKQIQSAQIRYDTEKGIFNLDQSREQLEGRIADLQKQSAQLDMERIKALSDVLDKLKNSDLSTLSSLDKVLEMFGIQAPAGLTVNSNSSTDWQSKYSGRTFNDLINSGDPHISPNAATTEMWMRAGVPFVNIRSSDNRDVAIRTDLPSYASGIGYVPFDQIAKLHEGERVLTKEENASFSARTGSEMQLHTLAMSRATMEMQVVRAQQDVISADIARMKQMESLIRTLKATGSFGAGDLESLLAGIYGVRGRYGAGGFSKEYL